MLTMLKRILPLILMLFALGGCAEFLGAVAYQGISFFTSATQEDIEQAAIWRQSQQQLAANCRTMLIAHTRARQETEFEQTMKLCKKTLAFNEGEQPVLWTRRLADRWRDFQADKAVVPEPKMMERPVDK